MTLGELREITNCTPEALLAKARNTCIFPQSINSAFINSRMTGVYNRQKTAISDINLYFTSLVVHEKMTNQKSETGNLLPKNAVIGLLRYKKGRIMPIIVPFSPLHHSLTVICLFCNAVDFS